MMDILIFHIEKVDHIAKVCQSSKFLLRPYQFFQFHKYGSYYHISDFHSFWLHLGKQFLLKKVQHLCCCNSHSSKRVRIALKLGTALRQRKVVNPSLQRLYRSEAQEIMILKIVYSPGYGWKRQDLHPPKGIQRTFQHNSNVYLHSWRLIVQ